VLQVRLNELRLSATWKIACFSHYLKAQSTAVAMGVVNCTNDVMCPDKRDHLYDGKDSFYQNYPWDCCWKHANDANTRFIFQNPGTVPQSSSVSELCSAFPFLQHIF